MVIGVGLMVVMVVTDEGGRIVVAAKGRGAGQRRTIECRTSVSVKV